MKVTGCGMSLSPDKFTLAMAPEEISLDHEGPRPEYTFREVSHDGGYCAAFCLKDAPEGIRIVQRKIDLASEPLFNEGIPNKEALR